MKEFYNPMTRRSGAKAKPHPKTAVSEPQGWIHPPQKPERPRYPFHMISPMVSNALPEGDIVITSAPLPGPEIVMNWVTVLAAPVGMILVMLIMRLVMGSTSTSYFMFMLPMSLVSIVVAFLNYRSQKKKQENKQIIENKNYLEHLHKCEEKLKKTAKEQREILNQADPAAADCAGMTERSTELWNRSVYDNRFMSVRLGTGEVPLCVSIKVPEKDPMKECPLEDEARAIADRYRKVSDVPVTLDLKNIPSAGIVGDRESVVSQAVSLIVSASALHSYEALKIVVVYPREERELWEQIRWLPHVYDEKRQTRYIADNPRDGKVLLRSIADMIQERAKTACKAAWHNTVAEPHYLVVVADLDCIRGTDLGYYLTVTQNNPAVAVSSVFLAPQIGYIPPECASFVEVNGTSGRVYLKSEKNKNVKFKPDVVSDEALAQYCRRMAPIRIDGAKTSKEIPSCFTFFDAWKINTPEELPIVENWRVSLPSKSMQVPLGAGSGGDLFYFDFHKFAYGPHGLFAGGANSGKSSMIRSWVLSMATQFSPKYVNFVLGDFKQPGFIDGLEKLPHVVGTVSNLEGVTIIRNLISLNAEIERRQKFLLQNGKLNIYDCFDSGITEMPFLFVVMDELKKFKQWTDKAGYDGIGLLQNLMMLGAALGIHVVAGSQTTDPFSQIMMANAISRWCLGTTDDYVSKDMLNTLDATKITEKGRAFVKVGASVYEEIQPFYSDALYQTKEQHRANPESEMALVDLSGIRVANVDSVKSNGRTQLDAIVEQICKTAETIHHNAPRKVWLPPLPKKLYLSDLEKPEAYALTASIGMVDDPEGQQQYTFQIDIVKHGHVIIYGAPQTGKSTFLMSAAVSLLSHCAPSLMEMYLIGSCFKPLLDCPQVELGGDSFTAKPVISAVYNELQRRKKSGLTDESRTILLFVDDIGGLMADFRGEFKDIAQFGPGCRIYLLMSAGKLGDVTAIDPYLTRGYALWFSPNKFDYKTALSESEVDRIPTNEIRGRGILYNVGTLEFQTALPYRSEDELQAKLSDIHKRFKKIPKVQVVAEKPIGEVCLGKSHNDGCEVIQNFRSSPSLLILGDKGKKRDSLLRYVCTQLSKQPDVKEIIGIDLDETQYASIPGILHLHSGPEVDTYFDGIFEEVKRRFELTQQDQQLQFPKFIFLVNDWNTCLDNVSQLSRRRFGVNILQKGKRFGMQLVTACTYEDFTKCLAEDEMGVTALLSSGSTAMLDRLGKTIPDCYSTQFPKTADNIGDFYISSNSAERFELLPEGGMDL